MILTSLAIIPTIFLLVYIYRKDKKEKEPMKLLLGCFALGVLICIPVIIIESIEDIVLEVFASAGSVSYGIVDAFLVAALTEEVFKYLVLKKKTQKSKYFDCSFDGIVYAVFVSLGFATFENIAYVFEEGIATALVRMFTAVPGHMCFAVYMGYYFSQAKIASVKDDKKLEKKYLKKALFVPVILHGFYDFPLMLNDEVAPEAICVIALMLWFAYLAGLFIETFTFVKKASDNDDYILINKDGTSVITSSSQLEQWVCPNCKADARRNYCLMCGTSRPYA